MSRQISHLLRTGLILCAGLVVRPTAVGANSLPDTGVLVMPDPAELASKRHLAFDLGNTYGQGATLTAATAELWMGHLTGNHNVPAHGHATITTLGFEVGSQGPSEIADATLVDIVGKSVARYGAKLSMPGELTVGHKGVGLRFKF